MLKFNRISPDADFYSKLNILIKNQLYTTYQVDKILKILNSQNIDTNLQNTVDKYFEDDETSPQTDPVDTGEQEDDKIGEN